MLEEILNYIINFFPFTGGTVSAMAINKGVLLGFVSSGDSNVRCTAFFNAIFLGYAFEKFLSNFVAC